MTPEVRAANLATEFGPELSGATLNLFWQIVVNLARRPGLSAFVPVLSGDGLELGIADVNQRGYTPTGVMIWQLKFDYSAAMDVCNRLNRAVFDIGPEAATCIVATTMRRGAGVDKEVEATQ